MQMLTFFVSIGKVSYTGVGAEVEVGVPCQYLGVCTCLALASYVLDINIS